MFTTGDLAMRGAERNIALTKEEIGEVRSALDESREPANR